MLHKGYPKHDRTNLLPQTEDRIVAKNASVAMAVLREDPTALLLANTFLLEPSLIMHCRLSLAPGAAADRRIELAPRRSSSRFISGFSIGSMLCFGLVLSTPAATQTATSPKATRDGSVVTLQVAPTTRSAAFGDPKTASSVSLVDLAPGVGSWYLLTVPETKGVPQTYHLETAGIRLDLTEERGAAIRLAIPGSPQLCVPWSGPEGGELARARASGLPFVPICNGRVFVRNAASGRRSKIELVTDLLRDRVRGGEKITTFVKDTVFRDRYRRDSGADRAPRAHQEPPGAPPGVAISTRHDGATVAPSGLALALDGVLQGRLESGSWYQATGVPGVFVTALAAGQVPGLGETLQGTAAPLDEVEASSLVYLVAYDLSQLEVGFALGTDHPRVVWSDRVPASVRDAGLPGPDGIGSIAPLQRTGILAPYLFGRVASTFTGGFKRSHGGFKFGELSQKNRGSHYGFVESGTILSRLQPDLATFVVWTNGRVELLTWHSTLDSKLGQIRHARQNGVPLVETDASNGTPRPGSLVTRWGEGNWSGSVDEKLRSLRAGLCQIETGEKSFLVYGYFTAATPSAMARVFLAAGCRYALHLDMNALEHTYLALYRSNDGRFLTEHLIDEMAVLDPEQDGAHLPRFVAVPDNRDFFYLLQRPKEPSR